MEWIDSTFIRYFFRIVLIGFVTFSFAVSLRWWSNLQSIIQCMKEIPVRPTIPVYTYLTGMRHTSRQKYPMTHVLQTMCGYCLLFHKFGIVGSWVAFRPFVFFFKPETVEVVLNSSSNIQKTMEYRFLHPWLGTGLLTSTGQKWRSRRKLLTPCFHFSILENFIPVFNKKSEILVEKMKNLTHREWVDIVSLITPCALDIICETTMGVSLDLQNGYDDDYVKAVHETAKGITYRMLRVWLWTDRIYLLSSSGKKFKRNLQVLQNFTRKVIKEKKAAVIQQRKREQNEKAKENEQGFCAVGKKALLEMLLQHHFDTGELTEEDIREEVDTFMFEGHDTTTMAIAWALYNIGLRPDIQGKIFEELDDIFGNDVSRPVSSADLRAMKYLECVIKESQRLYPSVPVILRDLNEDIRVLNRTLRPGVVCLIFTYLMHRDPEIFPNPEYFDPLRFTAENSVGRHPYAYIPFSAGPRNCIGQKFAMMEVKTVLSQILRNLEVTSLDPRDRIFLSPTIILRSETPLRMKIIARERKL